MTTVAHTLRTSRLAVWVLPPSQRRSRDEIVDALDVRARASSRSAFWLMLTLSAIIATSGVLGDSTATVIGAMIIAPLATPIMGVALSLALRDRGLNRRSLRLVALGGLLVVAIGVVGALVLPRTYDLLDNSQVTGRTSPTLVDLAAAIATGFAGAIGLARKDVSDILPGVAIAISLVPPLAVVGVCAGQGAFGLALGAFVLFLSNVLAMILAGTAVFALAYGRDVVIEPGTSNRRAYATLAGLIAVVAVVLGVNTFVTVATGVIDYRVATAAKAWVSTVPGSEVQDVTIAGGSIVISILTPDEPPSVASLRQSLVGQVPAGFDIVVNVAKGQTIDLGSLEDPDASG